MPASLAGTVLTDFCRALSKQGDHALENLEFILFISRRCSWQDA